MGIYSIITFNTFFTIVNLAESSIIKSDCTKLYPDDISLFTRRREIVRGLGLLEAMPWARVLQLTYQYTSGFLLCGMVIPHCAGMKSGYRANLDGIHTLLFFVHPLFLCFNKVALTFYIICSHMHTAVYRVQVPQGRACTNKYKKGTHFCTTHQYYVILYEVRLDPYKLVSI